MSIHSSFSRWLRLASLGALLWAGTALAQDAGASRARAEPAPPLGEGQKLRDGSSPGALSPEDREVVENLELLENMDQLDSLDLLMELSKED
jgi:hypothetical protein